MLKSFACFCLALLFLTVGCSGQSSVPTPETPALTDQLPTARPSLPDWQEIVLGLEDMPTGYALKKEELPEDRPVCIRTFAIANPDFGTIFSGTMLGLQVAVLQGASADQTRQLLDTEAQSLLDTETETISDLKPISFPKLGNTTEALAGTSQAKQTDPNSVSPPFPATLVKITKGNWGVILLAVGGSATELEALAKKQLDRLPR